MITPLRGLVICLLSLQGTLVVALALQFASALVPLAVTVSGYLLGVGVGLLGCRAASGEKCPTAERNDVTAVRERKPS